MSKALPIHGNLIGEPVQSKVDLLETLTETVLPAIERQEATLGGDVGEVSAQPLGAPQPATSSADTAEQTGVDKADGIAPPGILPHVEEQEVTNNIEQEDVTPDVVQTAQTSLTFGDESDRPQAEPTQQSGQNEQQKPSQVDLNRLGSDAVQNTAEREETDDILALVRAVLAESDATEKREDALSLFPLSLRIQRNSSAG